MKEFGRVFAEIRQTYWGDLLYKGLKFTPVAYYVFLTLYCIVLAVFGRDRIPSIAILPYVYSFLGPAILLIVTQIIGYIAAYIYRNKQFRIEGCGSLLMIFAALIFAAIPAGFGLYEAVEEPFLFQRVDIIFLTLSLWDVSARMLFSAYWGVLGEHFVLNWLKKLNKAAIDGVISQIWIVMFIMMFAIVFDVILMGSDTRSGLFWLALNYLSNAGLRWLFIKPQIRRSSYWNFKRKAISDGYHRSPGRYPTRDESAESLEGTEEESS